MLLFSFFFQHRWADLNPDVRARIFVRSTELEDAVLGRTPSTLAVDSSEARPVRSREPEASRPLEALAQEPAAEPS